MDTKCDRCHKKAFALMMSMYNTQMICMTCKEAEEKRTDYKKAEEADIDAIKHGNYNFKGIGL